MSRERIVIRGDRDLSGPLVGRTHRLAPTTKQYLNVYSKPTVSLHHGPRRTPVAYVGARLCASDILDQLAHEMGH